MAKIFISYRRKDTSYVAGLLYDHLGKHFGRGNIFLDEDSIPPGRDFRTHIEEAVSQCEVFLALIGEDWDPELLHNPKDFVRVEIESALRREIPVIPIITQGAKIPEEAVLPSSLNKFPYRNAVPLRSGMDLDRDMDRLIQGIGRLTKRPGLPLIKYVGIGIFLIMILWVGGQMVNWKNLTIDYFLESTSPKDSELSIDYDRPKYISLTQKQTLLEIDYFMRHIPSGSFEMGSTGGFDDEEPVHEINLGSFELSAFEVTQAQYQAIIEENPSDFPNCLNCPVERVSWYDALAFIDKLNELSDKKYRLPTEAEWEYAAHSGEKYLYAGGERPEQIAWYMENAESRTHPVGTKNPNAWGLYDMSGNIWEWCADYYESNYYSKSPSANPKGPQSGNERIARGGSWVFGASDIRISRREYIDPIYKDNNIGFRLARTP